MIKNLERSTSKFEIDKEKTQINVTKTKKFLNLNILTTRNDSPQNELKSIKLKKNSETQTEEIFFTKPWTFFHALNYTVLDSKQNSLSRKLIIIDQIPRLNLSKSPDISIKSFNRYRAEQTQSIQAENKKNLNIHTNNIEFILKTKTNFGQMNPNHFKYTNFSLKR